MPNRNYEKGRRKEYKVCKEFKSLGFDIVQRTAGSHSPIDIIAINKESNIIYLIQCKPDDYSESKGNKLKEDNKELNGLFTCKFILI